MTDIAQRLAEWRDATNLRKEVRELAGDALAEIERLRAKLAFVQRQMANNCDVDMEPCEPAKYCLCDQQAKQRGYEQIADKEG